MVLGHIRGSLFTCLVLILHILDTRIPYTEYDQALVFGILFGTGLLG